MALMVVSVLCCFALPVLCYILTNLLTRDSEPLYGIYAVPGRWFAAKYYSLKLLLLLARRKALHAGRRNGDAVVMEQHGKKVGGLDVSTGIGDDPNGHNSFYVNGSDRTGETRLILRVAVRPNNRRDVWFLLRLPGVGDLVLPRHPHCVVTGVDSDGFRGGGVDCTVIEPLKQWRVCYDGPCRLGIRDNWTDDDSRPELDVQCSFVWTATTPYFDFDIDVHPNIAATAIAQEKWTGQLFKNLQHLNQSRHFEHFGEVRGAVRVGGLEERQVVMRGVKDRSLGPRRWLDFHSYILNFIILDNGVCLHVGAFCFPGVISKLTSGFVIQSDGEVIPAMYVDLPLADLMEQADEPPMSFDFSIQPEAGEKLHINVYIEDVIHFNMDDDWSVNIREGLSRFTVNGVRGRGVCETLKRYNGVCPVPANYYQTSK